MLRIMQCTNLEWMSKAIKNHFYKLFFGLGGRPNKASSIVAVNLDDGSLCLLWLVTFEILFHLLLAPLLSMPHCSTSSVWILPLIWNLGTLLLTNSPTKTYNNPFSHDDLFWALHWHQDFGPGKFGLGEQNFHWKIQSASWKISPGWSLVLNQAFFLKHENITQQQINKRVSLG